MSEEINNNEELNENEEEIIEEEETEKEEVKDESEEKEDVNIADQMKAASDRISELEKTLKDQASNFKKVREKSEEEKQEKIQTKEELSKAVQELSDMRTRQKNEWDEQSLKQLAGDDEKMREKIMFNVNRLKDVAETKEERQKLFSDAYNMLAIKQGPNPIMKAVSHKGATNEKVEKTNFSKTEKGKEMAKDLGLGFVDQENKK